jgi:hypothetical protein
MPNDKKASFCPESRQVWTLALGNHAYEPFLYDLSDLATFGSVGTLHLETDNFPSYLKFSSNYLSLNDPPSPG